LDASSFQLAVIRFQKEEGDEKKIIHMDIPDGQDKVGEVLSFQLLDVSNREGEEGNHEWMLINSNQNEGKRVGLDSRLRGKDEG